MKNSLRALIFAFLPSIGFTQSKTCNQSQAIDTLRHQVIYNNVDQMPVPEGGMQSLYKEIAEIKYPANLRKENLSSILVAFIVNEKGEVYGERVIKTWDSDRAKKILYVIKKHKWKTGSCNGTKVSVLQIIVLGPPKLG